VREVLDIPVGDLMSAPAVTVRPETSIDELTRLMAEHDYNAFPVTSETGALQGYAWGVTRKQAMIAREAAQAESSLPRSPAPAR